MNELNITIPAGQKKRLLTAGKYCEDDIIVTADGIDTSDATAAAADIVSPKTAYVNGEKITGTVKTALGGVTQDVTPTAVGYMPYVQMVHPISEPTYISPDTGGTIALRAPYSAFGDATANDVVAGKTFTGADGLAVEGTYMPKLYGTYLLKETISQFTSNWQYCDFTEEDGIFAFFLKLHGEDYVRRPVVSIGLGQDDMYRFNMHSASTIIESYGDYFSFSTSYMDYSGDGSWGWHYYITNMGSPTLIPQSDNRYRIIDFTKPVDVTSEFYNAFMLCVDNTDITAFDIGVLAGGIDTSDATATAADIRKDKTAYVDGEKVTGSMATITSMRPYAAATSLTDTEFGYEASMTMRANGYVDNPVANIIIAKDALGNATTDKVLSGATFTSENGFKIEGTIATKTSSDLTASGATVTVPAGYYASNASKSVATVTQATPSVTVNSSGLITATATQATGYVAAGTKSATKQLTTQSAKTVTPSTSSQTAVASGVYTTGAITVGAIPSTYVKPSATKGATTYTPSTSNQTIASGTYCSGTQTIKGDANLVAGNIKSGVSIFGVNGSYSGSGGSTASFANGTEWTEANIASRVGISDVKNANGIWVAACNGNTTSSRGLYYSYDAKTWTKSNITGSCYAVEYANGLWTANVNSGLYYSVNGINWTLSNISSSSNGSLYNANGLWIAWVGKKWCSSTDGKIWVDCGVVSEYLYHCVCFANGVWVVFIDEGLYYSVNGTNWTQSNLPGATNTPLVYNANGIWVASTSQGIYYSIDAMTWTKSNVSALVNCICYANGIWVAGSYYSTDGKTWTQSNAQVNGGYFDTVENANGMWVASVRESSGSSYKGIYYSTDGKTWTKSNLSHIFVYHLYHANGVWMVGSSSTIYYSVDGKTWTQSNLSDSSTYIYSTIYYANNMWIASCPSVKTYYSVAWELT